MSEQSSRERTGSRWVRRTFGLASGLLLFAGCAPADNGDGPSRVNTGNNAGSIAGTNATPGGGISGSSGGAFNGDNPTGVPPMEADLMMNPEFDPTCASTNVRANRVLPTVMLVVDGSTSMDMPYGTAPVPDGGVPDGGTPPAPPSRWMAIRNALVDPTNGVVPQLQGLVNFGLALFGTMPSCPLPFGIIDPALNNAQAITTQLPVGIAPGTFTPTGPALDMVVDKLPDPRAVAPDEPPVPPQIIVLATDGDPNACEGGFGIPVTDYAPSIAAAMKAQAKGIKMYVVSVGMDAAATHLQEMANIGAGMPGNASPGAQVYYPTDPAALANTLATLIGAELSCDLALDGKGIKMGLECMGTVTLDGQPLECNGANGWKLTDETHIQLQGTACETYKNAADAHLIADFPCEIIIAI